MAGKAPQVQVRGAKELRRALQRMGDDLADLKAVHKAAADLVLDQTRSIVPLLSGALEGSGRSSGTKTAGIVRYGGRSVPYAGPIHFGWPRRNIAPNPFMYDAMEDKHDEVVRLYEERVEDLVNRVFRETPP